MTAQPAATSESPGSAAAASAATQPAPRWFVVLALLVLVGNALFVGSTAEIVAAGPDSSGYMNSARLLAAGRLRAPFRVPAEFGPIEEVTRGHFSPLGFKVSGDGRTVVPSYPAGLPLHFAAAAKLLGWRAGPLLVLMLASSGALWLCYLVARELGAHYALAGAAAVMLGAFPVFIFTSIQILSDTLATTWTLAAIWCGLRASRDRRWAAACGAAYAIAVLVRPTCLLLAPGLLVLLGLEWKRLGLFVAGGAPGGAGLALYNHFSYGSPLRSGYGSFRQAFGLEYGVPTAVHFAKWLALFLPAVALVFAAVAVLRPPARRREIHGVALVFAAIVGVYLFYDVSHDVWWCLRFILPAVGALVVLGVVGVETLARGVAARWPRRFRPVTAAVLTAWAVASSIYWCRDLHVLYVPIYEKAYGDAAQLVRQHVPANGIVVCSVLTGTLYYYTDLPTLVYDWMKPEEFAQYVSRARGGGRPIYAAIFDIEEEEVLRTRCPGAWSRVASVGNIGLWKLGE